jgi:hypothetical protein
MQPSSTTTIPITMQPRQRRAVAQERIDDEVFLYPHHSDQVHVLNSGAALIWMLCDGVRDIAGIATELAAGFGIPYQQTLHDVRQTVAHLQTLGVLEPESAEP